MNFSPREVLENSKRAARAAFSFGRKRNFPGMRSMGNDDLDELAAHAAMSWYEEGQSLKDYPSFQYWLFVKALRKLSKESGITRRMVRPMEQTGEWDRIYSAMDYGRQISVPQDQYIMAIQAANIVTQLPSDLCEMAKLMVDGCSLPEAATDLDVDLYQAMILQKAVRAAAQRIVETGAAENMFSDLKMRRKIDA